MLDLQTQPQVVEEFKKRASGLRSTIAGRIYGYLFIYLLEQEPPTGTVLESKIFKAETQH